MAVRKHLIHMKSNQLMTGSTTEPKSPNASDISYGEIAINYLKDKERIFIKNSDDEIVPFYSGKVIDDNEAVTAQALSDLDGRINDIEETSVNFENMESVTYSELKSKRDDGELFPGKHYRITDYVTTTSQENTQSAGHQFDVVVLALDESTLSENAHAMLHDGDTYFSTNNADLGSWELKYCINNDTDRFAWADENNGKGVIYYMKDEWNNECPYDFKNIQFKRKLSDGVLDTTNGDDTFVYTFNLWRVNTSNIEDASIIGNTLENDEGHITGVYGNKINPVSEYNVYSEQTSFEVTQYLLNDNVFLNSDDEDGFFYGCYTNILGYDCFSNTFGNNCRNNTFGNYFQNNTFGNSCWNNSFGNYCGYNTFGNECYNNYFGNNAYGNTFGNDCWNNSFGNDCGYNTFGNNAYGNTFGNYVNYNTFGNGCGSNTFGNNAYGNTFGNSVNRNSFGNDIQFIRFVKKVTINGTDTEVGADYINWCVVENGNKRIKVTFSSTTSSSSVAGNITITQGVNNATDDGTNNSNWVNITNSDTINLNNSTKTTKRTIYRPSTTVDISI